MSDGKKSRYKEKVEAGKQMYGPGCCAHKVTDAQVAKAKERAGDRRRFRSERSQGLNGDVVR